MSTTSKYWAGSIIALTLSFLTGQAVYTNANEGLIWMETSRYLYPTYLSVSNNFDPIGFTQSNFPWKYYTLNRLDQSENGLALGLTGHYSYKDKALISLFNDLDLIGNGFLTKFQYKGSGFDLVNSMFFTDNRQDADRGYVRTIKNITMYTNLAYLKYTREWNSLRTTLTFGRKHLVIGHGINSALFISNYSRPFDQLLIEVQGKKVAGLSGIIELDPLDGKTRILYIHTLRFQGPTFIISIGEAILAADSTGGVHLRNLNPFHIWSWEHDSKNNVGNGFLYTGFTWFPARNWRLFGELLIDDINFNHPDAFYLNRFGFLVGFQRTGFPTKSSNFWLEYSNVLNQVYQSYQPSHIYTHRGYPIGYYLGNDFDYIHTHYAQLTKAEQLKPYIDISYTRDGANGLETPFDNPWENEQGLIPNYNPPPHPTTPVTYLLESEFGLEYTISKLQSISLGASYQHRTRLGKEKVSWSIILRVWMNLSYQLW